MRRCATTLEPELSPEELNFLIILLHRSRFLGKHLEIGTAAGGSLCHLINAYPHKRRPPFVVIDPMTYFPNQIQTVRENLTNHAIDPNSIDFRIQTSDSAFQNSTQEQFDFIIIDGAHKIRYVMEDLRWARYLNTGGILCLHDYSPKYLGVYKAANRFLKNHPQYKKLNLVGKLLVLKKTAKPPSKEVSLADLAWAKTLAPLLQIQKGIKKRLK